MQIKPCPNCGQKPVFGHSQYKWYEYYLYHLGETCPYRIEIYQHSEEGCIEQWYKYIEEAK